jgi:uncharacterized membrane protein YkvA (DUF1232 family)
MDKRKVVVAVLIGVAALVYGISPIDIIPDVLVPFGFIDDAGVLVGAGIAIWQLLKGRKPRP